MDINHIFAQAPSLVVIKLIVIAGLAPAALFWFAEKVHRKVSEKFSPQEGMVLSKLIRYSGCIFLIILLLKELGFSLTPLLGAAGIVGIALGFAAQTSTSNIISGIFLLAERPFQVHDLIQVNNTTGEVMTVDLLAVKLKTQDNKFVRIPNETMLKSDVINLTKFPERRVDIPISIGYGSDLEKVNRVLLEELTYLPYILSSPPPSIVFTEMGTSSINLIAYAWVKTKDFIDLRSMILVKLKERLDKENIEIPFPQIVVRQAS